MKIKNLIFNDRNKNSQAGGMLVELLLTLALVAVIFPFIVRSQQTRIERARNIATEKQMEYVKISLERYIDANRKYLLSNVGKNIIRVNISDLTKFGLSTEIIDKNIDKFQIRVLKSADNNGIATLQGVIILNSEDMSALRTREIANLGDDKMGFVDKGRAFGAFGTWRTNAVDFDTIGNKGIIKTTNTKRGTAQYLWRLPSTNSDDSTMNSNLNMAGHNIINTNFIDSDYMNFDEILKSTKAVMDNLTFQNRTTIDNNFNSNEAIVAGAISADSRNMEIKNTLNLAESAKFSSFNADDLWVMNLNLSGISISDSDKLTVLRVNQTIDMITGHITAMYTTVDFDGSITPKLIINDKIEDSSNSSYYWDLSTNTANFSDISLGELSRMAILVIEKEYDGNTISGQLFSKVTANKNATATDFMNTISEIQTRVTKKYQQLNLE